MVWKILFLVLQHKEGVIWLSTSPGVEQIETAIAGLRRKGVMPVASQTRASKLRFSSSSSTRGSVDLWQNSLFHLQPEPLHRPNSKIETAIHKADASIRKVIQLLEAV